MKMSKKIIENTKRLADEAFNDEVKAYQPIAEQILQIVAEAKVDLTLKKEDKRPDGANEANKKIQELFYEYDICFADRLKIFQMALYALDYIKNCVIEDTQFTFERALAKKIGVDDMRFMRYRKMIELRDETNAGAE
jgi:hypothetical protein